MRCAAWPMPARGPTSRRATVAGLAAGLALGGCAVGPDFRPPAPPAATGYTVAPLPEAVTAEGATQAFVGGVPEPAWWHRFGSPALDALVEEAYRHNPTVEAARAALAQAEELVRAQQGYSVPTLAAGYTFERQKLAGNLGGNSPGLQGNGSTIATGANPAGPPYNAPVTYNFHTAQLSVSYLPDVFGANRRAVEALAAQADVARFQQQAAYLTLAANVVGAAVTEASLRAQIAAGAAAVVADRRTLDVLLEQQRRGYVMRADVAQAEATLAAAQAVLPPLTRQLEQNRDLLRALVGRLPDEELAARFELADLRLPDSLPVSLPADLVRRRPDVAAAEASLHAATASVGVAEAARIPLVSLTGELGGTASVFSQIWKSGGPFWNLNANLAQTLFDGGTLRHRQHAAEQATLEAAAQYRSAVLGACQNVADALHAITTDAQGYQAALDSERAARASLAVAEHQTREGLTSPLALYAAQAGYQQAVINRVQAEAARLADSAGLFMALGGGAPPSGTSG